MKHRYRIDPDYFLRMASARGWEVVPIHGLLFICEPPEGRGGWRVFDHLVGIYGPKASQCFHTDRVPAQPDRRVVPWCDCCWRP